uniref:Band 7 domain-containing protein n=1 Tax=Plectus sambesii TaxID=2011161 RepID=A0A914UQ70_9BILA
MRRFIVEIDRSPPSLVGRYVPVLLLALSWILLFLTLPFSLVFCLKIVHEYKRMVVFRLGRLLPGPPKGPGIIFVMPCIDTHYSIDMRTMSFDVPPQELLTKDSVTVSVDAAIYFRASDPTATITNVSDAHLSTKQLAQTTLRNLLGTRTLTEIMADREGIARQAQLVLDEGTAPWGIKVERVEVKDIRLPYELRRVLAAEAEAAREAGAKVVAATGELNASAALKQAADCLMQSPTALHLRYLQTLAHISATNNHTIVLPLPMDLLRAVCAWLRKANQ